MFKSPAPFSDVLQGTLVVSSHMGFVCLLVSKFVVVHFAWKIEEKPPHPQTSCSLLVSSRLFSCCSVYCYVNVHLLCV